MNKDPLGKYLGLPPIGAVEEAEIIEDAPVPKKMTADASHLSKKLSSNLSKEPQPPMTRKEEAENDYDYARENMYNVIEKGTTALEELLGVATQSQHPRAYEVLATTMKALVDANKELVQLSKKKVEEEKNNDEPQTGSGGSVTNNNLFVGTTHDLLKVLADMRKNGQPNS
jgi:hypothetical protein